MKDKFIKYCGEVMGWEVKEGFYPDTYFANKKELGWTQINPYDDLNQMAEVVEKLSAFGGNYAEEYEALIQNLILDIPLNIKQAFRDFIISTIGDSE